MNNQHSYQTNKISNLIAPPSAENGADSKLETRAILAFILLKELDASFDGADKMQTMANKAPQCVHTIYTELQRLPSEHRLGMKKLTEKVSLDPRSYQHHITKVYKDFIAHAPQYQPGNPTMGMLMCLIVYLVELCQRFLENGKGHEIPSIHGHATRLMLDTETPLSPPDWTEYLETHPPRGQRPPLERRPSLAADAAAMLFYVVEAYAKYTK